MVDFDTRSMESYCQFLRLKKLPAYSWKGSTAVIPDEYAGLFNGVTADHSGLPEYIPMEGLFDYQEFVSRLSIRKRKFAVFMRCGLGKTLVFLEFARYVAMCILKKKVLIVSPIMVIDQTIEEASRFYQNMDIRKIKAADLQRWLNSDGPSSGQIGITNFEAIRDGLTQGNLGCLIIDESSMMKSQYGAWGTRLIDLGRGLEWKLALTGTPAPNDRIEYANHAIFLDNKKTQNEFLARYFVNRGQTQNRWEIKPLALRPFYRDLSHWCIFLNNPATYGWKDNCGTIPPIHVHIDRIDLTREQRSAAQKITGNLFVNNMGGIGERGKLSQLAKGKGGVATNKPEFIRNQVNSWKDESTIIWCRYNDEQESIRRMFPEAAYISGETPYEQRMEGITAFTTGVSKVLISKLKILGFGLNLQIATRQVFSGLQDSYEEFTQGVHRSNRVGSTKDLNVHIPVTELEEPMVCNVLKKADRVDQDIAEQEAIFKSEALLWK